MTETFTRLEKILREDCQLLPSRPILVGISGGPDSLCLVDVLNRLGYQLVVAHFNHQLRPEAVVEARKVRQFAEIGGLSFVYGEQDVAALAREGHLSLEEAARFARYRFLFAEAQLSGAQAVTVAHTADDQVETVLMHLLRGSGLSGLQGMPFRALPNPWSEAIPLVRPLLETWREQVMDYCAECNLEPISDPSNLETTFFRNRLRHELIPYLERYNPAVRQVIWRMALVLRGDLEALEPIIDQAWNTCVQTISPDYIAFDLVLLGEQPLGLQRQVLRRAIARLRPGLRDIGFESLARAIQYIADPNRPPQIDFTAGLRLMDEQGQLWLSDWGAELPPMDCPQMPWETEIQIAVPGVYRLKGGWRLVAEPAANPGMARQLAHKNDDPFQAWAALDSLESPLVLRTRRAGDRLQPFGMSAGSTKLSDLMINAKIPRRARRSWPLVCAGDRVVWVPGYCLADPFRLTDATRLVVHLSIRSEEKT